VVDRAEAARMSTMADPSSSLRATEATPPVYVIRARRRHAPLDLKALWTYRELVYFFIWRDVKVRYRQTVLGGLWAVIQPFITMVVFSVIFGKVAGISSDGLPYPIFTFTALLPWTFFSTGVQLGANSLVGSQNLLKRVYFPRLALPIAAVVTGLVDLAFASLVLGAMMAVYGVAPSPAALLVLPLLLLSVLTALGVGVWFGAVNVRYRDVKYVLPFVLQVWLFTTPVAYPSSLIDEPWRTVSALNPNVGVVEGVRWALLGTDTMPLMLVLVSTCSALVVLISGLYYFRHVEGTFADVV
jgi:homopolymeric O-antigen transport system permease protein